MNFACMCQDCEKILMVRGLMTGWDVEWFYLRNRVWRSLVSDSPGKRFLCLLCAERRLGRKLAASDFRRNAKVNFVGRKSQRLRHRMRGLKPAKRLVETTFFP